MNYVVWSLIPCLKCCGWRETEENSAAWPAEAVGKYGERYEGSQNAVALLRAMNMDIHLR